MTLCAYFYFGFMFAYAETDRTEVVLSNQAVCFLVIEETVWMCYKRWEIGFKSCNILIIE